ncbi:alpha-S2-casein-like isoform X2 [Myotis lucifugus]|uniref:alpha-S2-casein-like isoform X2 n=1 Tax=Myotis lucifugus TaxID=59463 RepID=UPI000CCC6B4A|nr:alpha-S2-casein-like isoform X2 [Myotis lucifugus]
MKFLIFTCLLAVALANHKMETSSSSEESVNISQEKFKQERNVIIHPIKESAENTREMERSSISSSEESAEVPTENKINQFYQKWNYLQYLQALHQPQIVMNPWDQIKARAYSFFPTVNREQLSTSEESASFSQEEIPKTVEKESTEILTHKTKLAKENKNNQKHLNKMAQYHQKFPLPQYFKTVQHQPAMNPLTNVYQTIPNVV